MDDMEPLKFCNELAESEREISASVDEQLATVVVRQGLVDDPTWQTLRSESFEFSGRETSLGMPRITRDNPFLAGQEMDHLDDAGIVAIGTIVEPGMLAVSCARPAYVALKGKPNRKKNAPKGKEWGVDGSAHFPPALHGYEVTAVDWQNIRTRPRDLPRGVVDRVTISLSRRDSIAPGDLLRINGTDVCVSEIRADKAMPTDENRTVVDMLVPPTCLPSGSSGTVVVSCLAPMAIDVAQATSVGEYALITLRPMKASGAQLVTFPQISWLRQNGFRSLASEFVSLKSEDLVHRPLLQSCGDGESKLPLAVDATCPEAMAILIEELRMLGFDPSLVAADDSVSLDIKQATTQRYTELAEPVVLKAETINYRTYKPEPEGIFCEVAFGPETQTRRRQPARIELASPVIPFLLRAGDDPLLAGAIEEEPELVNEIMQFKKGVSMNEDGELEIVPTDPPCQYVGAEAIEEIFKYKGLSLTVREQFVHRAVYVLPPDLRPLVLLDSGNFAISDLNDLYRRIINRNTRLSKLVELSAPPMVLQKEQQMLQECVDALQANCLQTSRVMGANNRPLKDALRMALERLNGGVAKSDKFLGKLVDWSGTARVCVDQSLDESSTVLPEKIYTKLQCETESPILLAGQGRMVACRPSPSKEPVIRISCHAADCLGISDGETCVVHRPVTVNGVEEAERMMTDHTTKYDSGIAAKDLASEILEELLQCIRLGEPFSMGSDQRFMSGGGGSTELLVEDGPRDDYQEPKAIKKAPEIALPSMDDLLAALNQHMSNTCVFRPEPTKTDPKPEVGRVGGLPWLPKGLDWPCNSLGPIPFLIQLPLDPALKAGSLPFEVEPNSMLTVFWADDWWELGESSTPAVFIHSTQDLVQLQPQNDLSLGPLCELSLSVRSELPSWTETEELFRMMFGKLPPKLLVEFRDQHYPDEHAPSEESRVGGYGYWIQDPLNDLVMQLVSFDEAGLVFGDGGSLYITGEKASELTGIVQCY